MQTKEKTLSGKQVFICFLGFFVFIILVNILLLTLAIKTNSGLVSQHPYEQGLSYNKVVGAAAKQQRLGWNGKIYWHKLNGLHGELRFVLRDANRALIKADKIAAYFSRPTQEGMDFAVNMLNGKAKIKLPKNGLWQIRVFALVAGKQYQQVERLVIK